MVMETTEKDIRILTGEIYRGKIHISDYQRKAFLDDEAETLNKILKENFLSKRSCYQKTILFLPRRLAIFKFFRFPSHHKAEIKKMIDLQIVSQLPYSLEDVIYDYQVLEYSLTGYAHVLAVIVRREVIEKYLKLLADAGISLDCLTISSFGIPEFICFQDSVQTESSEEIILALHIDLLHSEICFIHKEKLLFSRSISYGEESLLKNDLNGFIEEIEKSLFVLLKERKDIAIKRIIIISRIKNMKSLQHELSLKFNKESDLLSPEKMGVSLENIGETNTAVCLGGLFLKDLSRINLLPPETHKAKEKLKKTKQAAQSVLLLILCLVLGIALIKEEGIYRLNKIKKLDEKLKNIELNLYAQERKITAFQLLKDQIENPVFLADIIQELSRIMPEVISLRSLSLVPDNLLIIEGYAPENGFVSDFQARLAASRMFTGVKLDFSSHRQRQEALTTHFKILAQIRRKDSL